MSGRPLARSLPALPDDSSPDGSAEIRHLITSPQGDLTHAVCPAGAVASVHQLPELYEAYYILAGHGEIWRDLSGRRAITALQPGRWVEMPPLTHFQYRADPSEALVFLVVVLPTWERDLLQIQPGGVWATGPAEPVPPTPAGELVDGWMSGDLRETSDHIAPDGSEIRLLCSTDRGGLAHCTLQSGRCSSPVRHQSVYEIWHVIGGNGEIWRSDPGNAGTVTILWPGVTVDIPAGTAFQFRSTGRDPLQIILLTMPRWPGPQEAVPADPGRWAT